jgi:hypothetical protein
MARKKKSLEDRIRDTYTKASKKAVREPRTWREVADRMYWERLRKILWRRYEVRGFEKENVSRVPR